MFKDIYNMTVENNILWAKRNIVDYIYNFIHLEGYDISYNNIYSIFNGYVAESIQTDIVIIINNLKYALYYIFNTINNDLNLNYIKEIHKNVGANLVINYGQLRTGAVKIGGTSYIPSTSNEFTIRNTIYELLNNNNTITEKALDVMLYLMRTQPFYDGNKRTSILIANKILISNGKGILSIPVELINKFNTYLLEYYESNNSINLKTFLYKNCIDGVNV